MSKHINPSFQFDSPNKSPGFLLWQLHTIWNRTINQILKPHGITHVQFVVLANIHWSSHSKEKVTQIQISKLAKIDPVVVSSVLKILEKKKLIKRKHAKDTRYKVVSLTQQGLQLLDPTLKSIESFDQSFFNHVPNLSELIDSMQKLIRKPCI